MFLSIPLGVDATPEEEAAAIPHVKQSAREGYLDYRASDYHKAYAIAPGGAWGWQAGKGSQEEAKRTALDSCQGNSEQRCTLYALNDKVVLDREAWAGLWGPYLSDGEAEKRRSGRKVGERFFDLRYIGRDGESRQLSDSRGRVVLLHFWGSWCPPCLREFPSLLRFYRQLQQQLEGEVELVMLQVREPFSRSRAWAEANGFGELPLFDSGVSGEEDTQLSIAGGKRLPDRYLARVFPSSYVLDKNGIVLFSHNGSIKDWGEYLPLFRHAVESTAK